MHIYSNLVILGLVGIGLTAFMSYQVMDRNIYFITTVLAYILSLVIAYVLTKKSLDDKFGGIIENLKKQHKIKVGKLKNDHDTTMLEKTIRDGTKTLIKNALDYFKIENIKTEMGPTAAIQNLQLDKYGQIIELLADFSLILPDYMENKEIVEQEINHQIDIYQMDEKPFAIFLQRIMAKYLITVNKKIREKNDMTVVDDMKNCPKCAEKSLSDDRYCKHCGHDFHSGPKIVSEKSETEEINTDEMQSQQPVVPYTEKEAAKGKKSKKSKKASKDKKVKKEKKAAPKKAAPKKAGPEKEWMKKGYAFYRKGDYKEAANTFTIAIDLNPEADQAYYSRGVTYYKLEDQEQAVDDLKVSAKLGNKKAVDVLKIISMSKTQEVEWEV